MRKYPTYKLNTVNITGTIAERYQLAVETVTEDEYDIVCRELRKLYGNSIIENMLELPGDLSSHYAVYSRNQGQYLIFLGDERDREQAQQLLSSYQR